MVTSDQGRRGKKRITEQQITEMKRRYLEGQTISAIARDMTVHRQTVSAYLAERHQDVIADDIRKQLLGQELQNHFNQLALFVSKEIRHRLDASSPGELGIEGTISPTGSFGFPYLDGMPHHITHEWNRMYNPPPREQHLLNSLREHTRESKLWMHWDRWYKKVSPVESTSKVLWEWLETRLEDDPVGDIRDFETLRSWTFGNIIRAAAGRNPAEIETLTQSAEPEEFRPVVYSKPSELSRRLEKIIEESETLPEFRKLGVSITELASSQSQSELRRLVRDIDFILAGIELMSAFPGKCSICPV